MRPKKFRQPNFINNYSKFCLNHSSFDHKINGFKNFLFLFIGVFLILNTTTALAQCASNATSTADEEILNVTFGTLNNTSTCATTGGAGSILNEYSNYAYAGFAGGVPNINRGCTVPFSVQIGTCGGNYTNSIAIFIDWNNDLDFLDAGEQVYTSAAGTTGPHTETGNIAIPLTATLGNCHMRVVNVETGTPSSITSCGTFLWGETEDYFVNVTNAGAVAPYISSTITQIVSGSVSQCATYQQIICLQVVMGAGCSAGSLTQFLLGAGSSTNFTADVSNIHIFYTGTSNVYVPTNEFVAGGTTPAGSTNTINGSQTLQANATNYFWITYDMNSTSTIGDLIDGSCTQITVAGSNQTPISGNPAGSGTIVICPCSFSLGSDVTSCSPLNYTINGPAGYDTYLWSPGGATTQNLTVTTAGTYSCTATLINGGLVVNGNFNAGNTGFTTSYVPGTGGGWGLLSTEGQYAITTSPNLVHNNFIAFGDHTTGTGNMMVINGSAIANTVVWSQTIAVTANTNYNFSAWVASVLGSVVAGEQAQLQFMINGILIGPVHNAPMTGGVWSNFFVNWNSGANTSAVITIVDQNTNPSGNDFAIDDISFEKICTYTDVIVINVITPPTVTVPANITVCNNGTIAATTFVSTPVGATFTWTNTNTSIGLAAGGSGNIASFTATNTGAAPVTATINVTPTLGGCVGTPNSYTITVNPTPTVTDPSDQVLCANSTTTAVTFTGNMAGTTYNWSNNNTTIGLAANGTGNIAAFTATNTGTAPVVSTVTVTPTKNGCPGTPQTFTFTINPIPTVTDPADQVLCANTSTTAITFNGNIAGTTYNWTNNTTSIGLAANGTGNIAAFTALNAGTTPVVSTITVIPTINGCPGTPQTFTFTVNPVPTVNDPSDQALCANSTTTAITFTGNMAGITYNWSNNNTTIGLAANSTGNIASFTAINSGTTPAVSTVTATPTINGCTGTPQTFTITVNPVITPTFNPIAAVCQGDPAPLLPTSSTNVPAITGTWSPAVSTTTAGTTTYTFTPNAGQCAATATLTITVNPIPTVTVNSQSICPTQTATLNALGATTYSWTAGLSSTTGSTVTGSPAATTSYTVTGTSLGCSNDAIATITVGGNITIGVTDTSICSGETATLIASGATTYSWSAGLSSTTGTSVSGSPAVTTSYTVTGTLGGCTGTAIATITVNSLPVLNITDPSAVCSPLTVDITAASITSGSTGAGILSYWMDAAGTITLASPNAVSASGTYYIQSTTATGCTDIKPVTVTINAPPVLAITNPSAVCVPGTVDITNSAITAGSTGGGTLSYWTDPAGTIVLAGPAAVSTSGTYYIQTTTATGCKDIEPVTVTISPAPVLSINNPPAVCSPGTVDITLASVTAGSTGAGILSYWTDAAGTIPLTSPNSVATGGTYYIQSTVGTCSDIRPVTVTINPLPVLTITAPAAVCVPNTIDITVSAVTAGSTGGGTLSYWSDAAGTNVFATPASVSTSGTYYIQTTLATGCKDIKPVTITINPLPVLAITNPPGVCSPNVVDITAASITSGSTGIGAFNYWTDMAGTIALTTPTAVSTNGTYYIQTTTAAGCSDIKPVSVTINSLPVLTISNPAGVCSPNTVDITLPVITAGSTGGGVLSYWTNAAGTISLTNPTGITGNGTYYIQTTTAAGCKDIQPVTVTINPVPVLTITNPSAVCVPNTVDITLAAVTAGSTGGGNLSYWTDAAGTIALNTPTAIITNGTYYIQLTTITGCTDIKPVTVIINPLPVLVITNPASVCSPNTVNLTAAAITTGSTGIGSLSYWTTAGATTALASPAALTGSGTYYIQAMAAGGCSDIQPVTVQINPTPVLTITNPAEVCFPNTVDITAASITAGSTGVGAFSYWTNSGATTALATPNAIAVSGTYYIQTTTAAGCKDIDPVIVTINPLPVLSVTNPAAVCSPATVNITAATTTAGSTGGGTLSYWVDAGATTPLNMPGAISSSGTYYIQTTTNGGCKDIQAVVVTINPLPTPLFAADYSSGCEPLCVNFSDNSSVTGGIITSWAWTFDGITSTSGNPAHCFTTPGSYTVGLTVTSSLGGCSATSAYNNMITVYPNPVAGFTSPPSASIINPAVTFTDNSNNAISWNWNFGDALADNNSSNNQNPVHTYSETGNYCVTLLVTSINGCKDSTTNCLKIEPEFTFFIPNSFSPNDDNINDEFYGKGEYINEFEMYIYDRWGNMVFYSDNINKHWDGKANHGSIAAQQDVYVYVVKITDDKQQKHKYLGTVTIVE